MIRNMLSLSAKDIRNKLLELVRNFLLEKTSSISAFPNRPIKTAIIVRRMLRTLTTCNA